MADGGGETTEIACLRTNLTFITDTVTDICTPQWFASRLVEKSFITRDSSKEILGTHSLTPADKTSQLMNSVFTKIQITDRKKHWFNEFVAVFSTESACAELVERLKRCVSNESDISTFPKRPPPLQTMTPPTQPFSVLSPPASGCEALPDPSSPITPFVLLDQSPLSSSSSSTPTFWSLEKVKATVEKLEEMFANLHAEVGIEMSQKEAQNKKFLEKFRSRLLLLPVRKATLHVKFFNANEKDIVEAGNTKTILAILCRFVDYRNYEILYYVVLKFCSVSLQESMKEYCKMLEEFETATTVNVYLNAVPDEVDEELVNGFSEMVVKINKPSSQCTLLNIRKLNRAIIKKSSLCSHSVYIGAVSRNCVVVKFRFPTTAVGWVLSAITSEFMATHQITEAAVDDRQLPVVHDDLVCVMYTC